MTDKESEWDSGDRTGCIVVTTFGVFAVIALALGFGLGFGLQPSNNDSGDTIIVLPYLTPPVSNSTPSVFIIDIANQNHKGFQTMQLSPDDVISRFFNPSGGPTNLFGILKAVDGRIEGINQRMAQFPCMNNKPMAKSIDTWGTNHTFYFQCSDSWNGGAGFDQFGVINNTFYLYENGGETNVAAIVSGWNETHPPTMVRVWYSVGVLNRNGSHAVVEILALPRIHTFEMTVAGSGIGYCGAQLKSNNITMNITGSADMGSCNTVDSVCVSAQNIHHVTTCTGDVNEFSLPAIGRSSYNTTGPQCQSNCVYGPSHYGRQVHMRYQRPDSTDFGPERPDL